MAPTTRHPLLVNHPPQARPAIRTHLQVSWCEHPAPRDVEEPIIRKLRPPLNVDHASGPTLDLIKAARQRYYASAGARPTV
ncbi:hypothetical protein GCM10009609_37340 [Pseudonocardia aurantiaca]|uniref:Uncharacterized protein n=1 Tax=Pseudonocardia aurantiaca TaxID=75290 RepID=A0ABW4FM90_9PSEU